MEVEKTTTKVSMTTAQVSTKKNFAICSVCLGRLKDGDSSGGEPPGVLPAYTKKMKVCSKVCWWFLQYALGFTHGFLLCDIVHKLCEGQRSASSTTCLKTLISTKYSPETDAHTDSTGDTGIEVKKEEASSDLDNFDCTVSFQDDVHYDDSTDINEDVTDLEMLRRDSRKKLIKTVRNKDRAVHRRARSCVHSKDADVQKEAGERRSLGTFCAQKTDVQEETRITRGLRTARKSMLRSKRKLIGINKKSESEKSAPKEKCRRLTDNNKEKVLNKSETDSRSEPAYQCEYCSKRFNAKRFLQRHLNRFHSKEIMVNCEICGDRCKNQKYLNVHMRKVHGLQVFEGEELFHCDQCPKSFNSRRGLTLHKEFVHSHENPVNCTLCDLTLKNDIYLKRHMKRSHSDSVICDICGAKFKSRLGLSAHLSAHRGIKSFFCEVCGMGFVRKTSLRRHVQQHKDVDYNCDTCSSSYKTFGSLSLHMLQIHQRGSYFDNRLRSVEKLGYVVDKEAISRHLNHQCVACGGALVSGVCPAHPTEYALMFQCHRCELTAEHIDDLLAHLKDHSGGVSSSSISVSFGCKVCRKVFPRKLYLNQHMKKHHPGASMASLTMSSATMSYVCHVCGKHFQQKQYLYVHMKQHLQPKSFACSVCDKKFTYKCNLKNHLTTHSEEKPFQCDICLKLFRRKEVLASHRLVHNPSLSPFKCHICGKGLSRKQYLKKHYQIMHPELHDPQPQPPQPEQQQQQLP